MKFTVSQTCHTTLDVVDYTSLHKPCFVNYVESIDMAELQHAYPHDCFTIAWFCSGGGVHCIDQKSYSLYPHRLFFIQAGEPYRFLQADDINAYLLLIDPDYLYREQCNMDFTRGLPYLDLPYSETAFCHHLFKQLLLEDACADKEYSQHFNTSLRYLFSFLEQLAKGQQNVSLSTDYYFLNRFREVLHTHGREALGNTDYAKLMDMSEYQLKQKCKQATGSSVKQFVIEYKLTEAKMLLVQTNLTISEIAYRLGFEDNSYFSRLFKQKTGTTPLLYAELQQTSSGTSK